MHSRCAERLFFQLLLLALALSAPVRAAEPGPHGFIVEKDTLLPMRDGVRLATDVYFPAQGEHRLPDPLPTILIRTPYNKNLPNAAGIAEFYAPHGYAVVVQDTRGRWSSEGTWAMLTDDGPDGFDTIEWIARQAWSNGKIGMYGISYGGGVQHAAAMLKPPHLTTVIPIDAMANMAYQGMRNAGAFELRFWNWTYRMASEGNRYMDDPATASVLVELKEQRGHYMNHLPLRRGTTPLKLAPEFEDWLVEAMKEGRNTEFWRQNNILDHSELYKDIPVYFVGGWYDSWGGNTTASYQALSRRLSSPVHLIMGPWIHFRQGEHRHGQVSFGPEAALPHPLDWYRGWYDKWLKEIEPPAGQPNPFATPVRIFVMGTGDGSKDADGFLNHGGFWRDEQEWPLARTRATPFYLHPDGVLSHAAPQVAEASTTFLFDPRNPVPTIGGNTSSQDDIMHQGAWDQRGGEHLRLSQFTGATTPIPLSARNDVLVFQSEPLEEDLEVTGEITVHLWASSSALDTDFTAKLIDVYPPSSDWPGGFDLNIGDGIVRGRFRESLNEEKLLEPGRVYPFTIRLYPTSNVFKKGHRIRVDISSSNFPRFDINPNTGEPLNEHRRQQEALNTIFHDASRPSHILLPVIPARSR